MRRLVWSLSLREDAWQAWNAQMKAYLLPKQATAGHAAGSWYEGHKKTQMSTRLYCTSLATLMLEVYYRHAPLYRTNAVDDQFRE